MSYAINHDEAPGEGLARAIAQQAEALREACAQANEDAAVFVHKARVRCKKIRAALRLGRELMGEKAFRRENAWWRDAARGLSEARDRSARREALETVAPTLGKEMGARTLKAARAYFAKAERKTDSGPAIATFCSQMKAWDGPPDIDDGDVEMVTDALGASYSAARKAMKTAREAEEPQAFHEWRKRAKAHALQLRLVRRRFDRLDARIEDTRNLAERLGEVQDIEVVLAALADWTGSPEGLAGWLETRRAQLIAASLEQGDVLFALRRRAWSKGLEACATG